MAKIFRRITMFSCLFLCIAMIAVGVYAATTASFTITNTVSFTPTDANLQILGYVDGLSTDYEDVSGVTSNNYYAATYNYAGAVTTSNGNYSVSSNTATFTSWSWGALVPNGGAKSDVTAGNKGIITPSNIVIYLQITSFNDRAINYTITKTGTLTYFDVAGVYSVANNSALPTLTSRNGFYAINKNSLGSYWSKTVKPTTIPAGDLGTLAGTSVQTLTFGTAVNVSAGAKKTTIFKITISPNAGFDATTDKVAQSISFTFSAV